MELRVITLICMVVISVHCDSHTLRYYYTGVSDKGTHLPEFSVVAYVDDREFVNYNSDSPRARPVTAWMERNVGPEYWDRETQNFKGTEPVFRHNVRTAMSRFNQTGGIHIVQRMYGCELRDDGTTDGYQQYGYDGREFLYLDTQSAQYMATMNEAQITTQRVNSPDMRSGERDKNYLENRCIEWLKKYTEYGREDLEKRVRPEVKVWGRQSDKVTKLQCLVYGFHPRAVDVKWVRNGVDDVPSDEMSPILPHPDGTYQIRVSAEVPAREGDTYSCHVDHSSLGTETLSMKWEPDNGSSTTLIIGIVCALAVIALAGIGFYLYKKRRGGLTTTNKRGSGYETANTSDTNSDDSNNPNSSNNPKI